MGATQYLIDMWARHLSPMLGPLWDSVVLWRSAALLLASAIVFVASTRHKWVWLLVRADHIEHDRRMFETADGVLAETELVEIVNCLTASDAISDGDLTRVHALWRWLGRSSNQFVMRGLKVSAARLRAALDALLCHIGQHFFIDDRRSARGEVWHALYPELRSTYDLEEPNLYHLYHDCDDQLVRLVSKVKTAYRKYRLAVKHILDR